MPSTKGKNKAAMIRFLVKNGESKKTIARIIGCGEAYVRAVRQRMVPGGQSPADRNWIAKNLEAVRSRKRIASLEYYYRHRADPDFRALYNLRASRYYSENRDKVLAKRRARYATRRREAVA